MPSEYAFDPMAEQFWTLPMAMGWIATRSIDAVRLAWNKYRAQHPDWRRDTWRDGPDGPIRKGWLLTSLEPATSLGIQLYPIIGHFEGLAGVMTVPEARKALWIALQEGLFPATGLDRLGTGRVSIPAGEWHTLEPRSIEHQDEVGRPGGGLMYVDPLVPAKAIWHLWPARRSPVQLPPLMTPAGDGYVPLYCAARWIASRGGFNDFDPEDTATWAQAYSELLGAITAERVRVVGLRSGEIEVVPGHKFAGVQVDYPHGDTPFDLMTSNEVYLRSYPYLDDLHWRQGFDDSLVNRRPELWTRLQVDKGGVRTCWPFELEVGRTGAQGRPSSMFLVVGEFERRADTGELAQSLREEARALVDWFKQTHGTLQPPTVKTIENKLRQLYRGAKRAPK